MTRRMRLPVSVCLSLFAMATIGLLWADDQKKDDKQPLNKLMEVKLETSKNVLAAVAKNDFSQVEKNAQELTRISNELAKQFPRNAAFQELGKEYRHEVQGLVKASRAKNSEAMALAYVKTTLSCFNCHNYIRDAKIASR